MRVHSDIIKDGMAKIQMVRLQEPNRNRKPAQRFFDFLVVIDFEATCFAKDNKDFCQEIIQFPAVLIDMDTLTIKDEFCEFVKPVVNPELTQYCTDLTGITQDMVQNGVSFAVALQRFEEWLLSYELGTKYTFTIVTDGYYDMGQFLYQQCQLSKIKYPKYAYRWMNVRKAFFLLYQQRWITLQLTVEMYGETFHGRPHNGSDDALNIAKIVISLLRDGGEAIENERILLNREDQRKNGLAIQNYRRAWYGLETVQNITRKDFLMWYKYNTSKQKNSDPEKKEEEEQEVEEDGVEQDFDEDSTASPWKALDKENINTDEDESSLLDFICPPYGPDQMSFSRVSPHSICSTHGFACLNPNHGPLPPGNIPRGRYSIHCRMTPLNHSLPLPHQFLPPQHSFHPKYPVAHPMSRRSSHPVSPHRPDQFSVPLSRAQRPPGMLRRAVEAAVAASENVS